MPRPKGRSSRTACDSARRRSRKARVLSRADLELIADAGLSRIVVARLDPGDVVENEAAGRVAAAVAGPEIEGTTRLHRPRQPLRQGARASRLRSRAGRPAQSRRRGGDPRDLAALCRGRAADDGRHRQDHPVRSTRGGGRALRRSGGVGRSAAARRTLPRALGRPRPDAAARPQGEHPRQDPRGHRGPAQGARLPPDP